MAQLSESQFQYQTRRPQYQNQIQSPQNKKLQANFSTHYSSKQWVLALAQPAPAVVVTAPAAAVANATIKLLTMWWSGLQIVWWMHWFLIEMKGRFEGLRRSRRVVGTNTHSFQLQLFILWHKWFENANWNHCHNLKHAQFISTTMWPPLCLCKQFSHWQHITNPALHRIDSHLSNSPQIMLQRELTEVSRLVCILMLMLMLLKVTRWNEWNRSEGKTSWIKGLIS